MIDMLYLANAIAVLLGLCALAGVLLWLWHRAHRDPFLESAEFREFKRALCKFKIAVGSELKPLYDRLLSALKGLSL